MNVGAQDAANRVKLRALLHDPLKPFTELYVLGESAKLERLNLALEGLTTAQIVTLSNGSLSLFSSATIDPEKPLENLVATTTVRDEVKHAILLIVPAPATEKLPYKIMVINDAFNAFPKGESRVLNMTNLPLAVKVGEHSKEVAAASFVAIPAVTKVNDMNQAQTIFYQKVNTEWSLLSERPTQFTKDIRHVFLLYQMPNVEEPQIRTILDTATE